MTETRTYAITTSTELLERFEALLAMFHWNGRFGHSGFFGMSLDGDGQESMTVDPEPAYRSAVQRVGIKKRRAESAQEVVAEDDA